MSAVLIIITALIFYHLGQTNKTIKEEIQEQIVHARKLVEKLDTDTLQPGIIHRPKASELRARKDDEKTKAGKEAMRETLHDIV